MPAVIGIIALLVIGSAIINFPKQDNKTATTQPTSEILLEISKPQDKSTVTSPAISIMGKTQPQTEVYINDQTLIADNNGNFSASLTLDEGENIINVLVVDDEGNSAEAELTVTYEPTVK